VKRSLHARELFDTEKVYVDGLLILLRCYEQPMRDKAINHVVTDKHVDTLFFQVRNLVECHSKIYARMDERFQRWSMHQCIGDILLELVRFSMGLFCF